MTELDALNYQAVFTEKEFDAETGLTYFGARYLDAEVGMWTAVDPMGQYHHSYSFVGGDPINMVDLWGLEGESAGDGKWDESFWDLFQDRGGTWTSNQSQQLSQTPDASNVLLIEPPRPLRTPVLREAPDRGDYVPDEFERLQEVPAFEASKWAAEDAPEAITTLATMMPWGLSESMLLRMGKLGKWLLRADRAEDFAEGASRLIGANKAIIDSRKLTQYALNPNHPVGGNKAIVFESRLGINNSNYQSLVAQVKEGVKSVSPVAGKVDKYGARFTIDMPVYGPKGSAIVRTGWIYKIGSNAPELTTIFVK